MTFMDYSSIVIKGTGKRSRILMDYLDYLRQVVPELYEIINEKLFCVVDNKKENQGQLFYGLKVYGDEIIGSIEGNVLYVVAILDSYYIVKELVTTVGKDAVVTDLEFIREINREIVSGRYLIADSVLEKKISIAKLIKKYVGADSSFIGLKKQKEHDRFEINDIIKALFFIYTDSIHELKLVGEKKEYSKKDRDRKLGIFLGQYSIGGAERVVSKLLPIYKNLDYDVTLFTDRIDNKEYDKPDDVERVVFTNGLYDQFDKVIDERYKLLTDRGISVACFHIPYDGYMVYYEVLMCQLLGIKTIIECHTAFINQLRINGEIDLTRKLYKMADRLVVLSKTDEYFWKRQGINSKYIQNPCDKYYTPKKSKKNRRTLVWVGRINDNQKGVFRTIPIMKEVRKELPDVVLYIVGEAKSEDELFRLKDLIAQNDLNDTVIICGYQEKIYDYYEKADAMLMTSPGEGFPMVIVEAKSVGVPTIMYDLPYLEMVKDGRGIISVKQGNIQAISDAIVNFLINDNLYMTLINETKESYETYRKYDIKGAWEEVLESDSSNTFPDEVNETEEKLIKKLLIENGFTDLLGMKYVGGEKSKLK